MNSARTSLSSSPSAGLKRWGPPGTDWDESPQAISGDYQVEQVTRLLAEATGASLAAYAEYDDETWRVVAGDLGTRFVRSHLETLWQQTLESDDVTVMELPVARSRPAQQPSFSKSGFYAGVATRDSTGHRVGCLWMADLDPRTEAGRECSLLISANTVIENIVALRQQARVDPLTGLWNRRAMDEHVEREWGRAARLARPISMLVIDVDHFKRFNDTLGHAAGDDALRAIADAMRRTLQRPGDLLARMGGEEFMVCLPDTDTQGACVIGDALRRAVEQQYSPLCNALVPELSVSVGVATVFDPSSRPDVLEDVLQAADRAMYEAKSQGRNRVAISTTYRSVWVNQRLT